MVATKSLSPIEVLSQVKSLDYGTFEAIGTALGPRQFHPAEYVWFLGENGLQLSDGDPVGEAVIELLDELL